MTRNVLGDMNFYDLAGFFNLLKLIKRKLTQRRVARVSRGSIINADGQIVMTQSFFSMMSGIIVIIISYSK